MIHKNTYTIDEFCRLYNIGRTTFYCLMKEGNGPEVKKIGRKTLISIHAAEKWLSSQDNFPTSKPAAATIENKDVS